MEFKLPDTLTVGGIDYDVKQKDTGRNGDFGFWECTGHIEIADSIAGEKVSESRKRQSFWHELTHAVLHQMGNMICAMTRSSSIHSHRFFREQWTA